MKIPAILSLAVVAFPIYKCADHANRDGGSALDPMTWNEEELLWFPFNAMLVVLTLTCFVWGFSRYRRGLPVFDVEVEASSNTLRDELRRHRRYVDRD